MSKTELEIKKITYEFEDGSKKVLEGKELVDYQVVCALSYSDYALPANKDSKVKKDGIIKGFTPCPMI